MSRIVKLFETLDQGLVDSSVKEPPAGSKPIGRFRRINRALPLVRVFLAAGNLVAAKDYSLTQTTVGAAVAYATPRNAEEYADSFLREAGQFPKDMAMSLTKVGIRLCAEDGDLLPETVVAQLREWGHKTFLALKVGGVEFELGPTYRAFDSHNINIRPGTQAAAAGNLHAVFENGAGEGLTLRDPIVLKPGDIFDLILRAPAGVATVAAAAKVPFRVHLFGQVYKHLDSAA